MSARMQHCFYCGEELGVYESVRGELPCCGSRDCERELQNHYAEQDAQARERAERDDYEAYR